MTSLHDLTVVVDKNEKNRAVKRLFSPATALFDISNEVELAFVALTNLTDKLANITDVFCHKNAKAKLSDEKFLSRCINTYQYRHSHNVKFPDYRAKGTLRLTSEPHQFPDEPFQNTLSYAQTGADVNTAILLCAEFIYNDELMSIGSALVDDNTDLIRVLKSIGLSLKAIKLLKLQLKAIPKNKTIDDLSGNYLPQLRFPFFNGKYICTTPVVSNELQSKIHQYCSNHYNTSFVYNLERSANVGSLAASVSGRLKLFKSIPKNLKREHSSNGNFWSKYELLDALTNYENLKEVLDTSNEKQLLRNRYFESLVENLKCWCQTNEVKHNLDPISLTKDLNLTLSKSKKLSKFSYQPQYTRLFISAFRQFMKNDFEEMSVFEQAEQNESFIIIPNLMINDANAMNSGASVGVPSLIGIWGFVHKFERNINQIYGVNINASGFAICMHDFCLSKRAYSKELYQSIDKKVVSPGLIDSVECDLSISLVIRISTREKLKSSMLLNTLPTHLCGGSVHVNLVDASYLSQVESFKAAVESIPNKHGQWLSHHSYEKQTMNGFLDNFKSRYLVLLSSGYLFLEEPHNKQGVLDNLPHAFSENILTCARLTKYTHSKSYKTLFWTYKYNDKGVFLVC